MKYIDDYRRKEKHFKNKFVFKSRKYNIEMYTFRENEF